MTRPLIESASQSNVRMAGHSSHMSKVTKSTNRQSQISPLNHFLVSEGMQTFLKQFDEEFAKTVKDYEDRIDVQKSDIEKLQQQNASSMQQVQALDKEKSILIQRLQTFADLKQKYTQHMSGVVNTQNSLKLLGMEIREKSVKANEEAALSATVKAAQAELEAAQKEVEEIKEQMKVAKQEAQSVDAALNSLVKRLSEGMSINGV